MEIVMCLFTLIICVLNYIFTFWFENPCFNLYNVDKDRYICNIYSSWNYATCSIRYNYKLKYSNTDSSIFNWITNLYLSKIKCIFVLKMLLWNSVVWFCLVFWYLKILVKINQ